MKKLLSILASISIIASGSSSIMAMSRNTNINKLEISKPDVDNSRFEKINQTKTNYLKTIEVEKTADVAFNGVTSVIIRNFNDLTNLQVQSINTEIATVRLVDNFVRIDGVKVGNTVAKVSADDAEDAFIVITVHALKNIDVDEDATTYVTRSTNLQIRNASELVEISAQSDNEEVAIASIENNHIKIVGISKGSTSVTVSALNSVKNVFIKVTVNELETIDLDRDKASIIVGQMENFKINNFQDLENVEVKSENTEIVYTWIDKDAIFVQALKIGNTEITVSAFNAQSKTILVTVNELGKIIVDKETANIYGWEPEIVNIINYSDLTNVNIQSSDEKIVQVHDYETGRIAIMRAGGNIGDQTTIEITADNAVKVIIPVLIKDRISLIKAISTLALDSKEESQVIDEVIRRNFNSGLTKEDIKIKDGSFKAPISEELKWGEVIIETNSPKYTDEIKLLIAPQMPHDPKTEELMTKIKDGKDLEERKPYWKEYFKYKGVVFFKELMPKNPWSFKEDEFENDENGDKQIKPEAFKLITDYLDAMVQRLLQQDFRTYEVTPDHQNFKYNRADYSTIVTGDFATIHFTGHYNFLFEDNSQLRVDFEGDVEGSISA